MSVFSFSPETDTDELDKAPPTGPELAEECKAPDCHNAPEPYSGKGPRPKYCADHKRGKGTGVKRTGAANTQAIQAAAILAQYNNFVVVGLKLVKLDETASEIAGRNDAFELMAAESLRGDPALCRAILKSGSKSGSLGLLMAYGLLLSAAVPAAMDEVKERKAAKEAAQAESTE